MEEKEYFSLEKHAYFINCILGQGETCSFLDFVSNPCPRAEWSFYHQTLTFSVFLAFRPYCLVSY
jgi:hypothetical protein